MVIRTIVFCGGGSGGHVMPALTLIEAIKKKAPEIDIRAFGSYSGIEERLFRERGVPYKPISTGKLRRYFSWQNFLDLFRLVKGLVQAFFYLMKLSRKETIIFSTGGFVTVPVVIAGWMQGKKVFIHEQTSRVGLANKIGSIFSSKVLLTFEASLPYFPSEKTVLSGYPLREEILSPPKLGCLRDIDFKEIRRPVLFLTGGGNGSRLLNEALRDCLPLLEEKFFIIHQCGSLFLEEYKKFENENYRVFDFISDHMIPLLNEAEVVVSRSGAGTVMELMSLGKPSVFIPLRIAQKNEQYHNALEAHEKLGSIIIEEKDLNKESLLAATESIRSIKRHEITKVNPTEKIIKIIFEESNRD